MSLALLAGAPTVAAAGSIYESVPDAIKCDIAAIDGRPGGEVLLYLAGRFDGGKTVYHTVGRLNIAVVYDVDGRPIGGPKAICDGKSLGDLAKDGRTVIFGD